MKKTPFPSKSAKFGPQQYNSKEMSEENCGAFDFVKKTMKKIILISDPFFKCNLWD